MTEVHQRSPFDQRPAVDNKPSRSPFDSDLIKKPLPNATPLQSTGTSLPTILPRQDIQSEQAAKPSKDFQPAAAPSKAHTVAAEGKTTPASNLKVEAPPALNKDVKPIQEQSKEMHPFEIVLNHAFLTWQANKTVSECRSNQELDNLKELVLKATSEGGTKERLPIYLADALSDVAKGKVTMAHLKYEFLHTIEAAKHERESNEKLLSCLGDKVEEFMTAFERINQANLNRNKKCDLIIAEISKNTPSFEKKWNECVAELASSKPSYLAEVPRNKWTLRMDQESVIIRFMEFLECKFP
jgi:hypothetical protein